MLLVLDLVFAALYSLGSGQHADALLSAQEAQGPRHGIRAFQDARLV